MKGVLERLQAMEPAWAGHTTALLALVALFGLRTLLRPEERRRAVVPATFLVLAVSLRLAGSVARMLGGEQAWAVLNIIGLLFLVVGLTGTGSLALFGAILRHRRVPAVVRDLFQIVAVAITVAIVLYQRGFDPVSVVATGGLLTAVVGLALQSTIANVFAGLALPIERALSIGDWIQITDRVGRIRATTIVTKDGDAVIVPNNQLLTTEVTNFSRPSAEHRTWVRVGFHYRHAPNEVRDVLLGAVRGVPGVLVRPRPDCFPVEFGDSAVIYALRYWIRDYEREVPISGEVHTRVWYAARRAGLEIPFPIRTLVSHAPAPTLQDALAMRRAALAHVDIFAPIEGECRERLATAVQEAHFGAGEDVIREREPGSSMFIVIEGEVEVHLEADGARRVLATLGAGNFFGEMSLMTGEPRQATCTAKVDTTCLVVDQRALRLVFEMRPDTAEEISIILAERQSGLDAGRQGLAADARARVTTEARSRVLKAIRRVFGPR
jgi:small-conductance mechanosensitive channel/CRP-like cAMP-binding protein